MGATPGAQASVLPLPPTPVLPTKAVPPDRLPTGVEDLWPGPKELGFSSTPLAPVMRAFTLADLRGLAVRLMDAAVLPDRSPDRSGRRMAQEKGD
jgi:hypothetical protein